MTADGRTRRHPTRECTGAIRGLVVAVAVLMPAAFSAGLVAAESPERLFATHALALCAAGVAGDGSPAAVLAGLPGAGTHPGEVWPALWRPFFENAVVTLGRLRSARPVALYYNPLLDVALLTVWEARGEGYRVVTARALPGERLTDAGASATPVPSWLAAENGPVEALARTTTVRLDAFRLAHPAQSREAGRTATTLARTS